MAELRATEAQKSREEADHLEATHDDALRHFLHDQEELVLWPLRDAVGLLGVINVFLLINVDSYTRDDLMTLTALNLSAHALRPGLVLEATALKMLATVFEALHIEPGLVRALAKHPIRRSVRSGEWLVSDSDYEHYLNDKEQQSKIAEPLGSIVKLQTVAKLKLPLLESALLALGLLLLDHNDHEGAVSSRFDREGHRRTAFFNALLELANACVRSSFAQNIPVDFLKRLAVPKDFLEKQPPAVAELKRRQQNLLANVQHLERQKYRRLAEVAESFLEGPHAQEKIAKAYLEQVFERTRLLCMFQLQLVNVSAYNETGRAVHVAAMMADPEFKIQEVPLYWLLRAHSLMVSLGYSLSAVKNLLALFAPEDYRRTASLLHINPETFPAVKNAFVNARELLKNVGKTGATTDEVAHLQPPYAKVLHHRAQTFLAGLLDLSEHFPAKDHRQEKTQCRDSSASPRLSSYRNLISLAMTAAGRDPQRSVETDHLESLLCSVEDFFDSELQLHRSYPHETPSPPVPSECAQKD